MKNNLSVLALAASTVFAAPLAQGGILSNPASIVDHGSYITDTVNHLDWYKFSNAQTTVGMSYNAVIAQFVPLGWSAASIGQVQGLQTQFGWVADTPTKIGITSNFGLTDEMGYYLGYTSVDLLPDFNAHVLNKVTVIAGMTSELYYVFDADLNDYDPSKPNRQTTRSESYSFGPIGVGIDTAYGDYVTGAKAFQADTVIDYQVGTWLSRASSAETDADPGCRLSVALPCTNNVPEPASIALVGLGFIGLSIRHRRKAAAA